ncbi:MAG: acetyl-CoA carboxylase carboxyltransferase subunit beta [Oscillospiraceae bacterium]|nr:acetyl-CoA carboxylase carboxyltransferase subunit beta [Oscillospiraceae bacterium]
MQLEDLLKQVTDRFNFDDTPKQPPFKCPRCSESTDTKTLSDNMWVCPKCGYHSRISAFDRIKMTADEGSFTETDKGLSSLNPIEFPGYEEKISEMQEKTGLTEAVITGICTIHNEKCVIGVMDSHFMMASMGSVVGEKITRAFELAQREKLPLVLFTASGGARMQEGLVSLMQMAKTSGAAARLSQSGGLYITVLTDPTTGGVTASFASLGDVIIAEPKALIGFAGRRVIEGTIKQRLPEDFQSAEFMLENGFVDMIVDRKNMRRTISHLIRLHRPNGERTVPEAPAK